MAKSKAELLLVVHELIWKGGNILDEDELCELKEIVNTEMVEEAKAGNLKIREAYGMVREASLKEGGETNGQVKS